MAPTPTFSPRRAAGLMFGIGVALAAMVGRVAYLQTYGRERSIRSAERQQYQTTELQARRGIIETADGNILAGTVETRALYIDPKFMNDCYSQDGRSLVDMENELEKLAKLIDKDPNQLEMQLSDRQTSRYIKVAEDLDPRICVQIEKLNLPGVGTEPEDERYYPMGSIAAHVLGGTGKDGHGLDGIELKYDQLLAGRNGWVRTLKDARRRAVTVAAEDYCAPEHGTHLILTIDGNIQTIAEQELGETCEKFHAKRGEVVVMNPNTGDIVAMANWPTFNPANVGDDDSPPENRRNNCLVSPMEPGSVIKPFIAGLALEQHITSPSEVFHVHGPHYTTPYGRHIQDVEGYDQLAFWDVLVKSSNIGMSMLGERMGNAKLYAALNAFAFGKRTGVELPGEDPGRVNPLRKWSYYSTESISQGYEVMLTPMQLCRGFCAYANGGRLVSPHIIKGTIDGEGNILPREGSVPDLQLLPEAVDPGAAAEIRRILCDVVIRGTAAHARSKIYNIFGKTGTAHISEGRAGYSETRFNSSFVGGAPYEDPKLVVAFVVHEPDRSIAHYGGTVSAPGASRILERSLSYMNVEASPDLPLPPANVAAVLQEYSPKLYLDRDSGERQ